METTEAKLMEFRQEEERLKLHYEANIKELSIKVKINLQLFSSIVCVNMVAESVSFLYTVPAPE